MKHRADRARRGIGGVSAALVGLLLAGCAPAAPQPAPAPVPPTPSAAAPAPEPTPEPSPEPQTPLALVVHASNPLLEVSEQAARAVLDQGADDWADLGLPAGPLTVVTSLPMVPGAESYADPGAALERVRQRSDVLAVVPADAVDPSVRVLTVGGRHPLADPVAYPLRTAGRPPESVARVTIVGDVMLGRRVGQRLARGNDPAAVFRPLADRLAAADLTVGTFEASLSDDGPPYQGGDSFSADPEVALPGLRAAGFDAVSLANNHVGDFGERALLQTFDLFDEAGIARFGAGRNVAEARAPRILEVKGQRIAFVGTESIEGVAAGENSPGVNRLSMPPRTGPVNLAERQATTRVIEEVSQQADVVIVMPHWGTQYTHRPEASQRDTAQAFAAAGADAVIGSHPHWVQGWDRVGDVTVVNSLGNFVFDMNQSAQVRQGVFVELTIWDGRVVAVDPVAYEIGDDFAPRLAGNAAREDILSDIAGTSTGPYARPTQ
ncbi:hypothetical protein CGZ98_09045 [Enemella evansiae]|uniref:CapA family protein n=1 Tax=Enemella evansiae TaxID=2016499 RepID=UPI000B974EA2|nr:CapA family protein [Enemella evansiae]OYO12304.1 hypothetical protein CGZ98_09045 [Enemella evansiae]